MLCGELGHEVGRQRRRIGERLVEGLGECRQEQLRVGPHEQLVMIRSVALGDESCLGALVEASLLEADRERVYGLGRLLRRKRRQHSRVDAAGEQNADRHIGKQMRSH